MNKQYAITKAVEFLVRRGYNLDALKAAPGYDGIRNAMHNAISEAVSGYLSGTGYITTYRLPMITAVSNAYLETLDAAYQEGGGELPVDEDTAAWARGMLDAQFGFIDQLFDDLKELRKEGGFDTPDIAIARADGYTSALDGFAVEAQMRGGKNIMLTWHLGSTEKHCTTCSSLDGNSHKISWYIERDYIPRKSGSAMECGGWNCDCTLTDKNGNEYTV